MAGFSDESTFDVYLAKLRQTVCYDKMFKCFLEYNNIGDKLIPNSYPQLQRKVEAYNKIEQISSIEEGRVRYDMFVREDKSHLSV